MRSLFLSPPLCRWTLSSSLLSLMLVLATGCPKSTSEDEDGGVDGGTDMITFDLPPNDAQIDMAEVPVCGDGVRGTGEECDDGNLEDGDGCSSTCEEEAVCGNGVLEAGESCDDNNTADGDGCSAMCRRESRCGDGVVDAGEVCDDRNNMSGDGCRSDCLSNESCGNGVIDHHVGEACDGGDGCVDCAYPNCGNGVVDAGELCDDGNAAWGDGCATDCTPEPTLIIDHLEIGESDLGCDFSGDGAADNAFARALGGLVGLANGMFLGDSAIDLRIMLTAHGFVAGTETDPEVSLAWYAGVDADGDASNDGTGMGTFYPDDAAFAPDGSPATSFMSRVNDNVLAGGPEDILLPIAFLPIDIKQGYISGRLNQTESQVERLEEGRLCGVVPVATAYFLPNLLSMFGMDAPACDGSHDTNLADVLAGGTPPGTLLPLRGVAADVDVDGDGLEVFEVQRSGEGSCQPVIVACVDGDGTRVEGHDCVSDSRFQDGWSSAFLLTAVHATLVPAP